MKHNLAQDLEQCALPSALEMMGERWSFLILRGALSGIRHFEEFQSTLGIARNILANRLSRLVENGILVREPMQCDRRKVEYRLTEKGQELAPVMIALRQWGEKWGCGPLSCQVLADRRDRLPIRPMTIQAHDGRPLGLNDLVWLCRDEVTPMGDLPEQQPEAARPGLQGGFTLVEKSPSLTLMSVHRIQPQPFFADKNRAFWNLQALGWAGAFLLRGSSTIANGQPLSSLIPVMISTVSGYSVTLLIAVVFRFLQRQRPIVTWGASIVTVVLAAALVAFIDAWVFSTQNRGSETAGLQLFLGAFYLSMTLLGAWSALYYAINFYLTVEEQQDQLLRLENQASSAQLAMLRYQLNPHFLFNTLNSISTLVLLKQTDRANAMLSRLSSFLRYTLINEPTAQVTIEQEVETLKLYLEIEKMRFEDRLRPVFSIDPAVAQSRLPSLLLQPLVENAIKYAVTPKEEGAEISITAQPAGENVRIVVSDSGPGLNEGLTRPNSLVSEGTGVGLANIRDRLIQAFGERQSFETRSTPGGFSVLIEMPLNLDEPSKVAA